MKNSLRLTYILGFLLVTQNHFQCTKTTLPLPDIETANLSSSCNKDSVVLEEDVDWEAYGFRIYEPTLARFVNMDTLVAGIT